MSLLSASPLTHSLPAIACAESVCCCCCCGCCSHVAMATRWAGTAVKHSTVLPRLQTQPCSASSPIGCSQAGGSSMLWADWLCPCPSTSLMAAPVIINSFAFAAPDCLTLATVLFQRNWQASTLTHREMTPVFVVSTFLLRWDGLEQLACWKWAPWHLVVHV